MSVFTDIVIDLRTVEDALARHRRHVRQVFEAAGDDALAYGQKVQRLHSELKSLSAQVREDLRQIEDYKIQGLVDEEEVTQGAERVKRQITGLVDHVRLSVKDLTPELTRDLTEVLGAAGVSSIRIDEQEVKPQATQHLTKALQDLREESARTRDEFNRLNLENRRGESSTDDFRDAVERLTEKSRIAQREILSGLGGEVPEAIRIKFGQAETALQRFETRAREVASGQTRLRTRIGAGARDALEDLAIRLPGGSVLGRAAGVGAGALGGLLVGGAAVEGTRRAISAAIEYESRLVEVKKTAGLTRQETAALGDELLKLSAAQGFTTDALTTIAASAGQLGIKGVGNLRAFTEAVAMLESTSDLTADRAADSIGKLANVFELPVAQARNMGSVLNGLSNTTAASAADIVSAMLKIAPAARSAGVSFEETAGLAATLISAGNGVERTGTQLRNIFTLMAGKGKEMSSALGITQEAFENLLSKDALQLLLDYTDALGDLSNQELKNEVRDTFGLENVSAIELLVANTRQLGAETSRLAVNLEEAAKLYVQGRSLSEEYAQALDSASGQWRIFIERIKAGGTAFGTLLTPAIKGSLEWLNALIDKRSDLERLIDTFERLGEAGSEAAARARRNATVSDLVKRQREVAAALEEAEVTTSLRADTSLGARAGLILGNFAKGQNALSFGESVRTAFRASGFVLKEERQRLSDLTEVELDQLQRDLREKMQALLEAVPEEIEPSSTLALELDVQLKGYDDALAKIEAFRELRTESSQITREIATIGLQGPSETLESLEAERELLETYSDQEDALLRIQVINTKIADLKANTDSPDGDPKPPLDPDAAKRAREQAIGQLQTLTRQQELRTAESDAEREALQRLYAAQDELNRALEIEQTIQGGGSADQQLAAQLAREKAAQHEAEAVRLVTQARQEGDTAALEALTRRLSAQHRLIGLEGEERQALQALHDNTERLAELETQRERLARSRANADDAGANAQALDEQLAALQALIDAEAGRTEGLQDALKEAQAMKALYEGMPADARQLLDTLGGIEAVFGDLTAEQADVIDDFVASAAEGVAQLQQDIGTLRLEYEATDDPEAKAAIQQQVAELVDAANAELRKKLGDLLSALPEGTSPAIIAQIEAVYSALGGTIANVGDGITEAEAETENWADSLDRAARVLRTIGQLGNVFGVLSDGAGELIDGISSVMDNVAELQRVRESLQGEGGAGLSSASGLLQQALPVLGVVSGFASAAMGLKRAIDARTERSREEARERREAAAREAEAMRALQDQLKENEQALRDNIRALIAQDRVGEQVTGEQAQGARDALGTVDGALDRDTGDDAAAVAESFLQGLERIDLDELDEAAVRSAYNAGLERGLSPEAAFNAIVDQFDLDALVGQLAPEDRSKLGGLLDDARQDFDNAADGAEPFTNADAVRFFEDLATLGIEGLDVEGFQEQYDLLREQGKTSVDAIQEVLDAGLREAIETLSVNLGGFAPTVDGAIERIGFFGTFLGTTGVEAVASFLDYLLTANEGAGVDGLSDQMRGLLNEIATLSADGTLDEADRARIQEIYGVIASTIDAGGEAALQLLGGLSTAQVEALLGELDGLLGGTPADAEASRSAAFSRGVTEFQANEFVYYLEELVYLVEQIVTLMGGSLDPERPGDPYPGGTDVDGDGIPDRTDDPAKPDDTLGDPTTGDFDRAARLDAQRFTRAYTPPLLYDPAELAESGRVLNNHMADIAEAIMRPPERAMLPLEVEHALSVALDVEIDGRGIGSIVKLMSDEDIRRLGRKMAVEFERLIRLQRGRP